MSSRSRRPSLLGGLLWTGLGILFLMRNFDVGPDLWFMTARYWPILLILLGLAKVIDYYRQKDGISLRIGEVFGLLFLFIIGSAVTRLHDSGIREWITTPIVIGGGEVRFGSSFTYSDEVSYTLDPDTPLRIENSKGSITVTPGSDREVRVQLRKVIYNDDEALAKEIADKIELLGGPDTAAETPTFVLKTNRDRLSSENHSFRTDIEIQVPQKLELQIQNLDGLVRVTDLEGKLNVRTTNKGLEVDHFTGQVVVANRRGRSRLKNITGDVTFDGRGRVEVENINGNVDIRTLYSPVEVSEVEGIVKISNTDSRVTVSGVSQPVTIVARGTRVTARDLQASLTISTSNQRVQVSGVASDVSITSRYGNGTLEGIKGNVDLESNSDRFTLREIGGHLVVNGTATGLRVTDIEGHVEITTSRKDVTVTNFSSGCNISNEHAVVTLSTRSLGTNDITVKNRNGDIELILPEDAAFQIEATARKGRVNSNISGLEPASVSGDTAVLKGTLKTGGPKILLEADYSNIDIRTLRSRSSRNRRN